MRPRLLGLALLAVLATGVPAYAAAPAARAAASCEGLPKHGKWPVVDAANVVPPDAEAYLAADLLQYRIMGNEAIVAATVPDLGGDDVASYAKRLFDCWGIGDAQSDDGILILLAMRERVVRIEAGAGLSDRLGDPQFEAALNAMVAPLRAGDVALGLRAAAVSLVRHLGGTLPDTKKGNPGRPAPTATPGPGNVQDGGGSGADDTGAPDAGLPGFDEVPTGVSPYGSTGGGGFRLGALLPLLFIGGIVLTIGRAIFRGTGLNAGSGSAWRGGFPGHGGPGWGAPSILRGGAWHAAGPPPGSWGSGSSSGPSVSSGPSGGGSFGGGSSGGGGASGSW
ncbi:MAG TPA: TPM domain-containing protein [Frankiaceae bacterium]|nr:TPM domain-containing protein [Frankiaceae bacterium]